MARIRSRAWTVLPRTPIHLQGRQIGRNRIRLRRTRPRAARGMTRVRNTSSRVQTTSTMPTGSAIHRIRRSLPVGPSHPRVLGPIPARFVGVVSSMRTGWIVTASLVLLGSACGGERCRTPTAPSTRRLRPCGDLSVPGAGASRPVGDVRARYCLRGDGGVRLEQPGSSALVERRRSPSTPHERRGPVPVVRASRDSRRGTTDIASVTSNRRVELSRGRGARLLRVGHDDGRMEGSRVRRRAPARGRSAAGRRGRASLGAMESLLRAQQGTRC